MNTLEQTVAEFTDRIKQANDNGEGLSIVGGGSKEFMGHPSSGEEVNLSEYSGILSYEPSELVITARAGTSLTELQSCLSESGQILAFEPPSYNQHSTIGGAVASGISGSRRPYTGSVRDYVLGIRCLNGCGELLSFGGQVIKNVAGYDVSRLMTGAYGTLGVLLDISLKVIPQPEFETAFTIPMELETALQKMHVWVAEAIPISAAAYDQGCLKIRLSGKESTVSAASDKLSFASSDQIELNYWSQLDNHQLDFFTDLEQTLWRLSVPSNTVPLKISGEWLIDWGGAQRWLKSRQSAKKIRTMVEEHGGHATLIRGGKRDIERFHPLNPQLKQLHQRIKNAFDPNKVLNSGRMYSYI